MNSQIRVVLTIVHSAVSVHQVVVGRLAAVPMLLSRRHQGGVACPRGRRDVLPQPAVMTSPQHPAADAAHASPAPAAEIIHIT